MSLTRCGLKVVCVILMGLGGLACSFTALAQPKAEGIAIKQVKWRYLDAASTLTDAHRQTLVQSVKAAMTAPLTPLQIDTLAEELTSVLRKAGFQLAHVLVTAEDLEASTNTGELQITVLEGKMGLVTLDNQTGTPSLIISQMLSQSLCGTSTLAYCKGKAIMSDRIDSAVLLLRELPNTVLETPAFSKGVDVGEGNVRFVAKPAGDALTASISTDNMGTPSTGRTRWNIGLDAANLLGRAENLYLSTSFSNANLKTYALGGDVLANRYGTRVGLGLSQLNLTLTGLTASTQTKGNSWSVYAKHPLIRTIDNSTNLSISRIQGRSRTDYLGGLTSLEGSSSKWVLGASGQLGDRVNLRDPRLSTNSWSVSHTTGQVNLDPSNIAADAAGAQTQGNYSKVNYSVFRNQVLSSNGQWTLSGAVTGQQAGKNMDSGEKMALGGPFAVRAYPVGELGSDVANIVNIDLKRHFDGVNGGRLTVSAFTDYASGQLLKNNYTTSTISNADNKVSLNGSGLGLSWARRITVNNSLSVSATWAHQGGRASVAEVGSGRSHFYVSAQASF